MVTMPLLLN